MKPTHKPGELIARVRERQARARGRLAEDRQLDEFLASVVHRYEHTSTAEREVIRRQWLADGTLPPLPPLPWWRKWF